MDDKYTELRAVVKGITSDGIDFEETVIFRLVPPDESESYYGTGYYLWVKTPYDIKFVDVRYECTTDIEILADRWLTGWYGSNAKEINKSSERGKEHIC